MHSFSAIALAALATYATAAPWEPSAKHSTHRRHVGPNGIEFTTYHPPVTYEVCRTFFVESIGVDLIIISLDV